MTYVINSLDEIGDGDQFEGFAKAFLKKKGFIIVSPPAVGPDGGKDLIVTERFVGKMGNEIPYRWLVSCKFKSKGHSVGYQEEGMVIDRLQRHSCNGFLAFYSTLPSQGLSDYLEGLRLTKVAQVHMFDRVIFDGNDIMTELNADPALYGAVIKQFMPSEYAGLIENSGQDNFGLSKGGL
jgi:hypothetical protein